MSFRKKGGLPLFFLTSMLLHLLVITLISNQFEVSNKLAQKNRRIILTLRKPNLKQKTEHAPNKLHNNQKPASPPKKKTKKIITRKKTLKQIKKQKKPTFKISREKITLPPQNNTTIKSKKSESQPQKRIMSFHEKYSSSNTQNEKDTLLTNYKEQIINLLSKKIKYPYIARKRGYEGFFLIRLSIDKNGNLIDYDILERKGKKILEKTAVKTIKKLRFPKHGKDTISITVPIVFKLKKGR